MLAGILQKIQETVNHTSSGGEQEEDEQEANRAEAFLHTASQKQQSSDAQQELREASVVKGEQKEAVDVAALENCCSDAEALLRQAEVGSDAKQNAGEKGHYESSTGDNRSDIFHHSEKLIKVFSLHLGKKKNSAGSPLDKRKAKA